MLEVSTSIAFRVSVVDEGGGVEWLMNITKVVDDQADGHRLLIFLIGELISDLRSIVGLRGADLSLEELREVSQSLHYILVVREFELREVIGSGTFFVIIRCIDEMPWRLETVAFALDIISPGGALSEGVVALIGHQA